MRLEGIIKYIQDGSYLKLKQEKEKLCLLKTMIRNEQDALDIKRLVWKKYGVVGEFEICKQYSYNHLDLNVLLLDLGIFHQNTYIKGEELSEEEKEQLKYQNIPKKYFLKYTANKDMREQISQSHFDSSYPSIDDIGLTRKVGLWRETYNKYEKLNSSWEKEKVRTLTSYDWMLEEKITIRGGMLSVVESPIRYRTDMVIDILGLEATLKMARIDPNKLVEFTARGFLTKKDLKNFRKIIAVNRRYLLMTIQKEMKKKEYWITKMTQISNLGK
ncbi:hypothetical protein GC096_25940 [Paenibacillus sp. LMG 31461]|uniref:Uncharacterized protein n=1 Tax=Paenibacillus plantarum TaxID=2654975 RepID=A0ABX1XI07_9BACL|nr:hypothetical protein [Paenibacillus plantarum]NOU67490.1 hypothetical protein [Paenibacillus plantarum]